MNSYIQKEENIRWIQDINWEFNASEYMRMVKIYRELNNN